MFHRKIKSLRIVSYSLLFVGAVSGRLYAQSNCSRCVSPSSRRATPQFYAPPGALATRVRYKLEDTPSVPSPFYSPDADDAAGEVRLPLTGRRVRPALVPTQSFVPDLSVESSPKEVPAGSEKPARPEAPATNKPSVAEKISQRYSDPRVLRMLNQLTPQGAESFYSEVSALIDERHLGPASYSRRVDNALNHVALALDIPAFVEAARVLGSTSAIADFQQDLQLLRTTVRPRSANDAIGVLREVQQMAAHSIGINPSAIGLEFTYGATDSLDQFSTLLPPEKYAGPSVGLKDNVVGIGVEVESNSVGLKITKLLPGGPAALADFQRGDIITHVDGRALKKLDMNRAVDLIVGPVGTPVEIRASRGSQSGDVTLTRQKIALHSVVDVRMENPAEGVGYLKLEQFADSTMNEIDTALMSLHQRGMKSLIIDLRGNPGGLLTTAIALSDRFLSSGTIVATRGRTDGDNSREKAHFENTWKMPLVVLVDRNSASASEIFAAAIQENHRGVIVGEKSYGKGTVQTLFPLQTFPAALRLTTAKFYSPDGREMAGSGVTPDVKVVAEPAESLQGDEALSEALRQISSPKTRSMSDRFRRTGDVSNDLAVAA